MMDDLLEPAKPRNLGRILLIALFLSLIVHIAGIWWATRFFPEGIGDAYYDQLVPRTFRVERVEIDPAVLQDTAEPVPQDLPKVVPVDLPPESVNFDHPTKIAPAPDKLDPAKLPQLDTPPTADFASALNAIKTTDATDLVADLESLRNQLVESESSSPARPVLPLPQEQLLGKAGDASAPGMRAGSMDGYSQLDDLLGRTGPLEKGTAPIFMPGDLLFDYDQAELKGEALDVLRKLGVLIQRNPRTRFLIEGHTDSFGDASYNLQLSQRRAEAVKFWLVEQMQISPDRIRTRGMGSTKLIAPASASIEGQKLNRRVEIVLEVGD